MNLKELSALLGLSPTTVSRALNGYPEVAKATKDRILAAATVSGYLPNQNAQRLAAGRVNSVAVVWTSSRDPLQRQFATSFFRHLTEVSNQFDLHLVSVPSGHDEGLTRIRGLFSSGAINAALFINPVSFPGNLELPFPSLVFGRRPKETPRVSWVDIDYRAMSHQAIDFLIQLGHRHLAVAGHKSMAVDEMFQGAKAAIEPFLEKAVTLSLIEPTAQHPFVRGGPTAVLCSNLKSAEEIVGNLSADGLAVGQDVSIIAFDDSSSPDANAVLPLRFTALRLDLQIAAQTVLQSVRQSITAGGGGSRSPVLLRTELVLGETTASTDNCLHPAKALPISHTETANANTRPALFGT